MNLNSKVNCLIFVFVLLVLYLILKEYRVIEGFSGGIDSVALESVASVYNNKELTVDNLKVTGNIEVDGYAKAKAFALNGNQYSHEEAKALQPDGIFYRSEGQAVIGMDDIFRMRNNNNGRTVEVNNGSLSVPFTINGGTIKGESLFGKRGIENDRDDHLPKHYRTKGMGIYDEFKNIIDGWSIIRTIVPWYDTSGGNITQFSFNTSGNMFMRTANEKKNKWNGWKKVMRYGETIKIAGARRGYGEFINCGRGDDNCHLSSANNDAAMKIYQW